MLFIVIYVDYVSRAYDLVDILLGSNRLPLWQRYMDLLDQILLEKLQMDTVYCNPGRYTSQ
jgi:hypothetical protein